jgi:hypothetical protein
MFLQRLIDVDGGGNVLTKAIVISWLVGVLE